MTPKEAISYIENYGWSTTKLGLERTQELLASLGNPQKKLRFIHIGGSNGKGSTSAMLASILKSAGYRTGLYISPYIQVFNERIQRDGEYIRDERLAEITERVKGIADGMEDHPSQFELVTAIAIQYYYEEKCDFVVLEVGMGGALDSTNAIDAPEVSVITNIGLEHTEYLGDTLEIIAETKAGIIKEGSSCVCYDSTPEVTGIIKKVCKERKVPLTVVDFHKICEKDSSLDGQVFEYGEEEYRLPLLGKHQLKNAAVVLEVVETLRARGFSVSLEAVKEGMTLVTWPARFEVLNRDPVFILDGGHNPQCAEALTDAIEEYLPDRKAVFLLGVPADKDYDTIIDMMMPYAGKFVCVTPLSDRALSAEDLANHIKEKGGMSEAANDISKGIRMALDLSESMSGAEDGSSRDCDNEFPIIAFGSLYLAGAVRTEFSDAYKKWLRNKCKAARNSLSEEERIAQSKKIASDIYNSTEFKNAKTVMLYKWTSGEVRLDELEPGGEYFDEGKQFVYPLVVGKEMVAICPGEGDEAWSQGAFGIREPRLEAGTPVLPEEIDLVICPLVGFDDDGNRLGMGGGYYDKYLPKCTSAAKIGVAFPAQKLPNVPTEPHDVKLDAIYTGDGSN